MEDEYNVQEDVNDILDKVTADRIKEMQHGEGVLTFGNRAYQSVLQKIATAINDPDKEYRQALLLASFLSPEESDKAVYAIAECRRYGAPITVIVDRIIARCGVKGFTGGRVQDIKDALTHQSITTNTTAGMKKVMENQNKKSPLGNQ